MSNRQGSGRVAVGSFHLPRASATLIEPANQHPDSLARQEYPNVAEPLRCVRPETVITGWDFSTGAVKCLAFDLDGKALAEVRLPTDLWTEGGVSELNLMQLEGQARATTRTIGRRLLDLGRLRDWAAGGISATHHTAGRLDRDPAPVPPRAGCDDHS